MSGNAWLPLAILMTSLAAAPLIFAMREESTRLRTTINLAAAGLKIALVAFMSWQVAQGETFEARFTVMTGLELVLQADPLAVLFVSVRPEQVRALQRRLSAQLRTRLGALRPLVDSVQRPVMTATGLPRALGSRTTDPPPAS